MGIRKIKGLAGLMLFSIVFSGCQKRTESTIISNDDIDNIVEQAENTEVVTTELVEIAENYDTYKTTIQDEDLNIIVNVDAYVDIPETDKLSIFRVQQLKIDQEFLDKVRTTLAPDVNLYDGWVLDIRTKQQIREEIDMLKKELEIIKNSDEYSNGSINAQAKYEEYQKRIDNLEEEYENEMDDISLLDYPSDYKLHSVKSLYEANSTSRYFEWQNSLNENGEIFYGVSNGNDGNYVFFYAQNNEDYGNRLHYRSSKLGYPDRTPVVGGNGFNGKHIDYSYGIWECGTEPNIDFLRYNDFDIEEDTRESVNLSREEALEQAEAFLKSIGLTDYSYYEGGLYYDLPYGNDEALGVLKYKKEYIFGFRRNIDGVFAYNEGAKLTDGYQGPIYVKRIWGGEGITVIVNDNGIVGFDLCSPIYITETVTEQASLIKFGDAKDIFEKMVVSIYGYEGESVEESTINIDKVVLRYTRISEPNNFESGLLIPTWDFIGSISSDMGSAYYSESDYYENIVVMSINAINGEVINQELGY